MSSEKKICLVVSVIKDSAKAETTKKGNFILSWQYQFFIFRQLKLPAERRRKNRNKNKKLNKLIEGN